MRDKKNEKTKITPWHELDFLPLTVVYKLQEDMQCLFQNAGSVNN